MKLLFLSPNGTIGGAERMLLDIIASFRIAHPDWRLALIAGETGALNEAARRLGVFAQVIPFPKNLAALGDAGAGGPAGNDVGIATLLVRSGMASSTIVGYVRHLAHAISRLAPDLIHSNGFKMYLFGAWAAMPSVPLVWHFHDFVTSRPLMSRLLRIHTRRCNIAVANSACVAADVRLALKNQVQVCKIWNTVDLIRFSPNGAIYDLDALCGMSASPDNAIRVGLIGTMARWKGHLTFLDAISKLPRELLVRCYIIGGPIYQTQGSQHTISELQVRASDLGIAEKVGFTGFVSEPAAAMRALDIVVHASIAPEPFGLVIAEAFACERAVIASAAGGVTEIADADRTALLYRPGDVIGLANQIARLVTDHSLRISLGKAARLSATRLFARERLAAELDAVYQVATSKRAA
jgi:glycosyltransferase involved in cell wall biosynthesis